ncbi:MAG TPA: MFS transporter [Verrucomicrobiae bacterium]
MQREMPWREFVLLSGLLFVHAMGLGAWFVPLATVLDAHGLQSIKPYAFATSAIAALISPLIFGGMADRHFAPVRVLRWVCAATGLAVALAGFGIQQHLNPWLVLALIQLQALCLAPTWSLSSSIVLGRLNNPQRQFGSIRAFGTLGWMTGCWIVSALRADASTSACYTAAIFWGLVAAYTFLLPAVPPLQSAAPLTWREMFGLDALALLKIRDHRVVFLTAALFSIPLAAFYPFTPTHLHEFGLERTSAWMSLGQVTEIITMVALARLLGFWRIKWSLAAGLGFGLIRYALCAMNSKSWVLIGVTLHGFAFTMFFITAQIYVDQRLDPAYRARGQALYTVMVSGLGNLFGYLGTGWWFRACRRGGTEDWTLFWGVLAGVITIVLLWFMFTYRGRGKQTSQPANPA